jgi:phosphotransferase system HPr-like phosphotransfer protein
VTARPYAIRSARPPEKYPSAGATAADAKSVLGVMGLGATSGQHVTVAADGPDAEQAVAAIVAILAEATRVGA